MRIKQMLWGIVPCLLFIGVASAQQNYNAVAGGDLALDFLSNVPSDSGPAQVTPTPAMAWYTTEKTLQERTQYLTIPAATAPGQYSVNVGGTSFTVTVTAPASLTGLGKTPVVLIDGFSIAGARKGAIPIQDISQYWDQLGSILNAHGYPVVRFQNSHECPGQSIEACAWALQGFLNAQTLGGAPITKWNVITHSMGGLIFRAYLSGYYPQGWFPPVDPMVNQAILLGSPNFGALNTITTNSIQSNEMISGSEFLWQLAVWNQGADDMRGINVIAVAGNASGDGTSDAVVPLISASLGFTTADPDRTRVVPYCHMQQICGSTPGLNYVDTESHDTAQIAISYFDGTTAWKSVGNNQKTDPILSTKGALMAKLLGADGSPIVNKATYTGLVNAGTTNVEFDTNTTGDVSQQIAVSPGYVQTYMRKVGGPIIGHIYNPDRLGAMTLISGRKVVVYGTNLINPDGSAPQLFANENQLSIESITPASQSQYGADELTVELSSIYQGPNPIWWTVKTQNGTHIVRSIVRNPQGQ